MCSYVLMRQRRASDSTQIPHLTRQTHTPRQPFMQNMFDKGAVKLAAYIEDRCRAEDYANQARLKDFVACISGLGDADTEKVMHIMQALTLLTTIRSGHRVFTSSSSESEDVLTVFCHPVQTPDGKKDGLPASQLLSLDAQKELTAMYARHGCVTDDLFTQATRLYLAGASLCLDPHQFVEMLSLTQPTNKEELAAWVNSQRSRLARTFFDSAPSSSPPVDCCQDRI